MVPLWPLPVRLTDCGTGVTSPLVLPPPTIICACASALCPCQVHFKDRFQLLFTSAIFSILSPEAEDNAPYQGSIELPFILLPAEHWASGILVLHAKSTLVAGLSWPRTDGTNGIFNVLWPFTVKIAVSVVAAADDPDVFVLSPSTPRAEGIFSLVVVCAKTKLIGTKKPMVKIIKNIFFMNLCCWLFTAC